MCTRASTLIAHRSYVVADVDVVPVSDVTVSVEVMVTVVVVVGPVWTTVVGIATVVVMVLVVPGVRWTVVTVRLMTSVTTCAGSVTVVAGTETMLPLTTTVVAGTRTSAVLSTVVTVPVTWIVRVAAAAEPDPPTTLPSQTPPAKSARMTGSPIRSRCGYARGRPTEVVASTGVPGAGGDVAGSDASGAVANPAAAAAASSPPSTPAGVDPPAAGLAATAASSSSRLPGNASQSRNRRMTKSSTPFATRMAMASKTFSKTPTATYPSSCPGNGTPTPRRGEGIVTVVSGIGNPLRPPAPKPVWSHG